jgi:hypothetical protein
MEQVMAALLLFGGIRQGNCGADPSRARLDPR